MKRLQATGEQKPQEISTKSKLEKSSSTRPYVALWAFSIFVDRQPQRGRQQNQGSIQTQRLKSGALNKETHEYNPTSPIVVYFLPASPIARPWAHNRWKTYQQRESECDPRTCFSIFFIWRVTFLPGTYVYKQASRCQVVSSSQRMVKLALGWFENKALRPESSAGSIKAPNRNTG